MRIIVCKDVLNEDVKRIIAYGLETHYPESLSNFVFGLNKKTKELLADKYPEIRDHKKYKSGGSEFEEFVFRLIINKSGKNAKSICKNLNNSGIGFKDWIAKEKDNYCLLTSNKANSVIRIDY